jgi:hypothetical protein
VMRANLQNELHKAGETRSARTVRDLNERHEKELSTMRALMSRETLTHVSAAKAALAAEFDEKLRQLERERLEDVRTRTQQFHEEMAQSRAALLKEFDEERARWTHERRAVAEELEKVAECEKQNYVAMQAEKREEIEKIQRKTALELSRLREKLTTEAEARQAEWRKAAESEAKEKHRLLRKQILKERDQQIEEIADKISKEARANEIRLEKLKRTETESLKKSLMESDASWKLRHEQLLETYREACIQCEAAKKRATESLEDRDIIVGRKVDAEKRLAKLEADKKVVEQAWEQKLVQSEGEWAAKFQALEMAQKGAVDEANQNQIRIRTQLREMDARRDDEMVQVEAKVRAAMARKDSAIATLRNQMEAKEMQIESLRRALDKHKRELLGI